MSEHEDSELFRDDPQRRDVCDRLVQFGHYNEKAERFEPPNFTNPERVRRARTLLDLALALFDGDGQLASTHLVNLDYETRGMVSDLLMELGAKGGAHVDRWLENTNAFFVVSPEPTP